MWSGKIMSRTELLSTSPAYFNFIYLSESGGFFPQHCDQSRVVRTPFQTSSEYKIKHLALKSQMIRIVKVKSVFKSAYFPSYPLSLPPPLNTNNLPLFLPYPLSIIHYYPISSLTYSPYFLLPDHPYPLPYYHPYNLYFPFYPFSISWSPLSYVLPSPFSTRNPGPYLFLLLRPSYPNQPSPPPIISSLFPYRLSSFATD